MNKTFEIKKYNLTGTFLETVKKTDLISDFSFSSSINAGQGDCTLELNLSIGDTTFSLCQFLKIYVFTDIYPNGKLMYTGMITKINGNITNGKETLNLNLLGLGSLLTFIYFKSGGSYTFNLNQDPAITLKAIIDYFNTIYTGSWLNYTTNVNNYGSNVNQAFSHHKCLDSIQNTVNSTNYWWNIRSNGELFYKPKPTTATHILTIGKDVDNLQIERDSEKVVNKYLLDYSGGSTSAIDGASQTSFGLRELYENKTNILDGTTATITANNKILKDKDYKNKTSIIINNSFDIEKIEIGDTISVMNTTLSLINLQVRKIDYSINSLKIELDEFDTLAKEIL